MSKVALICVPSMDNAYHKLQDFVAILPPSSILTIAACLEKAGHTVLFIDGDGMGLNFEQALQKVISFNPDYVGITAMTATVTIAAQFCQRIKQFNQKIVTIFGGIHATALPQRTLDDYPFVDYVVKGEGEHIAVKLLERLDAGQPPDDVDGIMFRRDGQIIDHPRLKSIRDLDALPLPAHHLLDYSRYRSYGWNGWTSGKRAPIGALYTARGCYRNCSFCSSKVVSGRGIRCFGVDRVMEELDLLVNEYKIKILYIQDDTFAVLKKRSMEICEQIQKRGYKLDIMIAARCDETDLDLFRKLKETGVNWCCFGVESGNQGILNNINKGITLDDIRRAFDVANEVGFHVGGNFMLGFPNETWETAMDTINLACSLPMDYASFAICVPFPGTDMYNDALERKVPMPPWSGFGLVNSPPIPLSTLSADELLKLRRKATIKFFTNPRYQWRLFRKFNKRIILRDFIQTGVSLVHEMVARRY